MSAGVQVQVPRGRLFFRHVLVADAGGLSRNSGLSWGEQHRVGLDVQRPLLLLRRHWRCRFGRVSGTKLTATLAAVLASKSHNL